MVMNFDNMGVNGQFNIHGIKWMSVLISILCILWLTVSFVVTSLISLRGDPKKGNIQSDITFMN